MILSFAHTIKDLGEHKATLDLLKEVHHEITLNVIEE